MFPNLIFLSLMFANLMLGEWVGMPNASDSKKVFVVFVRK